MTSGAAFPARRRRAAIRWVALVAAASMLLCTATATAQGRGAGGRGSRAETRLQDTLIEVDLGARTVTLGDGTFRVPEGARLADETGGRIRLRTLAISGEGREVLYEARAVRDERGRAMGGLREIVSLSLLEGDFE